MGFLSCSSVYLFVNMKVTDFYVLMLHSASVASIISKSFLVESSGSFVYTIISSVNKDNWTSLFTVYNSLIFRLFLIL